MTDRLTAARALAAAEVADELETVRLANLTGDTEAVSEAVQRALAALEPLRAPQVDGEPDPWSETVDTAPEGPRHLWADETE